VTHAATAAVSPLRDDSRRRRFAKLGAWAVGIAILAVVSNILGWDLLSWFEDVWDEIKGITFWSLVTALVFQTLQTSLAAVGWLFILRAAYPDVRIDFRPILTAYALSVAMNGVLPANMGTFALLLMFVALIPGATFAGVFTGYLVQKIFYTVIGGFVYLYLFLTVPNMPVRGSNSPHWDWFGDHLVFTIAMLAAAAFLLVLVLRIFWQWVKKMWEKAKVGGAILQTPKEYLLKVFLPSFGSWVSKLFVIGIFLGAYGIPVTFASIMHVVGSNSLASMVSVTPGGVGVNQAANVAALQDYTDATTATAYSLGQQLITTAWNVAFAIVLAIWVFGWTGGKTLVTESYAGAKEKVAEQKEARAEKKAEKRAAAKGRFHRHHED
jgi:uncharacterized membrane protein YbhN (UPF0104 family)